MSIEQAAAPGIGAYADYLKDQLGAEEKRKSSVEQRGLAVVSSAGALVTLLFALGALSTREQQTFVLDHGAKVLLVIAVAVFLLAAVCALATNVPVPYQNVDPDALRGRIKREPVLDENAATRDIALTSVKVLRDAKAKNQRKAQLLFAALTLEVVAVAIVAMAVSVVIL